MSTLAFDLGGTYLRCGLIDDRDNVRNLKKLAIPNAFNGHAPPSVWREIIDVMASYCRANATVAMQAAPIVIAFPGPVRDGRHAVCAPTVVGSSAPPDIVTMLGLQTGRDVFMLNDVSAAAWHLSGQLNVSPFMVVTISSGIGSKVVTGNPETHVFDGAPHSGEIGHLVVDPALDAPACSCGGRGHLGAIASGRGTQALARRMALADPDAYAASACARELGGEPSALTNEAHLVPAARSGDPWAWKVIVAAMEPLAVTLSCTTQAIGLQRIVLIGGFAHELGERYAAELTERMRVYCDGGACAASVDGLVTVWQADDEPCLRGAAAYARTLQLTR